VFVGRDRELAALEAAVGQLAGGRGAAFLISGEPGIGKTRLASELAAVSEARGIRVAWGRCWEAGGAPAFWPWQEALGALAVAFPDAHSIDASDPAQARFALFRKIAGALAGAAPAVIVLEDLHAADQSSALLLDFLAAQLRTVGVLIAGTYRDVEASLRPEIGDVLARVGRIGTVLALPRLRAAEVGTLVRGTIDSADDQLVARVFETTQGNPLFVGEMVRAGTVGSIPLGVREIIRQRLGLVTPVARRVLETAAVLGVEVGARELAALEPDIETALGSGLLVRRGDRLRFAHALYREALYQDMPRADRQARHRDAARVLAAAAAPAAEIAHHLIECDAAEAVEHAVIAARAALAAFAFEDAIALLERVRRREDPRARTRVLIALGEVRLRSGDPKGRELCVEGAQLARELGDAELLALAGLAYGSVFLVGAVDPVMVAILEEALAKLPAGDSGLRARTMARLAAARQPSPPALRDRDRQLAMEAVEMGRRAASRRELLEILQSAAGAMYGAMDPRVRMPVMRQLAQLAEGLGDAPRLIAAYVRLAMDHLELLDLAGYEQVADAYEQLAARFGSAAGPWRVPLMRSMLALAHDDFAASERWQAEAQLIEPDNPRARRARALHRIGFLRAAERHAELRASLGELRSQWLGMPYGAVLAEPRVASCLMRIGADDEVRSLVATLPDEAWGEEISALSLADTVWCTVDRTHVDRLISLLTAYEGRAPVYWLDVENVEFPTERSLAYLELIRGNREACEQYFAAALRLVEPLGRRSAIARMKFELADLMIRLGHERERARRLLAEARAAALPELAALIDRRHRTVARPQRFAITREGEYFAVSSARGTLRFKATRGMHYLAQLVERAPAEVHVLELVGATEADRGDAGPVVDARARASYRQRAEALRDVLEDAEKRGDADRAERIREELEALAAELSRGTALGGKSRRAESAVDRARSAVQRRIKDALDRIAEQDPGLGAWLRRVVRTGNYCSFVGGTPVP
jgi:hypothetical protein